MHNATLNNILGVGAVATEPHESIDVLCRVGAKVVDVVGPAEEALAHTGLWGRAPASAVSPAQRVRLCAHVGRVHQRVAVAEQEERPREGAPRPRPARAAAVRGGLQQRGCGRLGAADPAGVPRERHVRCARGRAERCEQGHAVHGRARPQGAREPADRRGRRGLRPAPGARAHRRRVVRHPTHATQVKYCTL